MSLAEMQAYGPFLIDSANQKQEHRSQSEDYVLVDPNTGLLGVFDSVGGRDKGRLVSIWQERPLPKSGNLCRKPSVRDCQRNWKPLCKP